MANWGIPVEVGCTRRGNFFLAHGGVKEHWFVRNRPRKVNSWLLTFSWIKIKHTNNYALLNNNRKPFAPGVNYGDLPYSSNFWICGRNPMVWPFKWNLFSSTDFHMVLSNMQQVVLVTFDKILQKLQLNWSLLRTFLWCFPFSIHKFSKLIL